MRFVSILCITCLAFATQAAASQEDCEKLVKTETAHAIDVLHNASLDTKAKGKELGAVFQRVVDIDWIGRYVLGRYWKTATPQQQGDYLSVYRNYLTQNYISKLDDADSIDADTIQILSIAAAPSGSGYEAKTLIQSKGDPDTHVDYLLDDKEGSCKVHDVRVEGVSLLVSQRSEFGNIAAASGVDGIIAQMRGKLSQSH